MNSNWIKYSLICLVLGFANINLAQNRVAETEVSNESIYIDVNASLIFSGEYLYYSLYCFNTTTKDFSQLSKMAYVELVGANGKRIFKHKIRLEKGRGYSDYFLPVDVASGNYKLVAYTNWMLNTDQSLLGMVDVSIINPYQSNKANKSVVVDKSEVIKDTSPSYEEQPQSSILDLRLNKQEFNKREQVTLQLSSRLSSIEGVYSVSVKRESGISAPKTPTTLDYTNANKIATTKLSDLDDNAKLPELRGELFKGIVASKNNEIVKNLKVAVSIGNDHKILKIAEVNADGYFYFNIDNDYYTEDVYLQILGEENAEYEISLVPKTNINTSAFKFENLQLKPEWKQDILDQSVYNQIESAYFEFRSDSLFLNSKNDFFKNRNFEVYNLDDYTRFKTLKETIKEYVKNTSVRNTGGNDEVFEIQGIEFDTNTGITPIVVIDGIMIDNHNTMMDYNALTIDHIKIYRDQFVIDLEVFQGAIIIETVDGLDNNLFVESSDLQKLKIEKPQIKKNYYKQQYTEANKTYRLPDYRQQLLWMPNLEITDVKEREINFYTSDVSGTYKVKLQGFTSTGQPVSIIKQFKVN